MKSGFWGGRLENSSFREGGKDGLTSFEGASNLGGEERGGEI